jgi:hypothetical protein
MLATGAEREFSTPSEYLQYVRAAYARPYTRGAPDPEMHRLARLDIEKYGVPLPDPSDPYRHVVRELADRAAATVMARRGVDITTRCAIGSLDEPSVNASCFRSANGFYAIVLHHGLMLLLHKHSKLLTAAVRPASVVYCNRLSPSQLTPELVVSWAAELGQIYRVRVAWRDDRALIYGDVRAGWLRVG